MEERPVDRVSLEEERTLAAEWGVSRREAQIRLLESGRCPAR